MAFPDDRAVSGSALKLPSRRAAGAVWERVGCWATIAPGAAMASYRVIGAARLISVLHVLGVLALAFLSAGIRGSATGDFDTTIAVCETTSPGRNQ